MRKQCALLTHTLMLCDLLQALFSLLLSKKSKIVKRVRYSLRIQYEQVKLTTEFSGLCVCGQLVIKHQLLNGNRRHLEETCIPETSP